MKPRLFVDCGFETAPGAEIYEGGLGGEECEQAGGGDIIAGVVEEEGVDVRAACAYL